MSTLRERVEGLRDTWLAQSKRETHDSYESGMDYQAGVCSDELAAALAAEGQGASQLDNWIAEFSLTDESDVLDEFTLDEQAKIWGLMRIAWNTARERTLAALHKEGAGGAPRWTCPDCGYDSMPYPPKDYHICPKCMVEFGNDDRKTNLLSERDAVRREALEEAAQHKYSHGRNGCQCSCGMFFSNGDVEWPAHIRALVGKPPACKCGHERKDHAVDLEGGHFCEADLCTCENYATAAPAGKAEQEPK